jgi:hypothetical protein
VAENWRDSDIDTNGTGRRLGWGDEVEADVKRAFGRVVGEAAGRFTLHVVFGTDKARERAKELGDRENGVADVVVKGALVEFAGKKVIAARVEGFFAVTAGRWGWLVKEGETEFTTKEKPVGIGVKSVVRETTRQGMQGDAGGGG